MAKRDTRSVTQQTTKDRSTTNGRNNAISAKQIKLLIAVIIALVILAFAKLFLPSYLAERKASQEQALKSDMQAYSQSVAAQVVAALQPTKEKLRALSQKDLTLRVSKAHTVARAETLAGHLLKEFDQGISIRLISPAQIENSFLAHNDLSFASREMIRQSAKQAEAVSAEWHFPEHAEEYIAFAEPVVEAEQALSVLHLTLKTDAVKAAFEHAANRADAYTEFRQVIASGGSVLLDKMGDASRANQDIKQIARIPGTMWTVTAQPSSSSAIDDSNLPTYLGAGVLALLLGAFAWWRTRGKKVAQRTEAVDEETVAVEPEGLTVEAIQRKLEAQKSAYAQPELVAEELEDETDLMNASDLDDELELDDEEIAVPEADNKQSDRDPAVEAPASIFRAYDIRGVVDETLTEKVVYNIGRALGSEALERGDNTVVVGRDGRLSSPALSQALIKGLTESGRDVIDIGMVPTPVLYFATHFFDTNSGVMLTGSHNPPNYNGIKMVLGGVTLANEAIQSLRERILTDNLTSGEGKSEESEIGSEYIRRITDDIPVALSNSFKVVVDAGNGVAGVLGPQLIRALGHDVIELYCDVDGNFPNHHPDPSQPENLEELISTVKSEGADLGLAFDGDGDRLGVVDRDGNVIWPDRQMMLFAKDVIDRNPGGEIIFDVKCSNHLKRVIEEAGGKATMWKTGHSLIKAKMKESGALLAGEMSGHVFFKERWYGFDDGLYTAARLLEILSKSDQPPHEILGALPGGVSTPELRLNMHEDQHAPFMATLSELADFGDGEVGTIDGIRVDYADGWGLIRPSNTTPCLVMRFEADNEAALQRIQEQFRTQLLNLDSSLSLPF